MVSIFLDRQWYIRRYDLHFTYRLAYNYRLICTYRLEGNYRLVYTYRLICNYRLECTYRPTCTYRQQYYFYCFWYSKTISLKNKITPFITQETE